MLLLLGLFFFLFMEWKQRNAIRLTNRAQLCCCVSFFMLSICTLVFSTATGSTTITCLDTSRCPILEKADIDFQELEETKQGMAYEVKSDVSMDRARRLVGQGSLPPRCTSKCGKCTPCKLVLVPKPMTAEYYSEAWRCKCGNKLYQP